MDTTSKLFNQIRARLSDSSQLLTSAAELQPYQLNCEGADVVLRAAIKIAVVADIKAILLLANELAHTDQAFSVHPISTGHNWGYNSALPNDVAAVLLDLGQLTNITIEDACAGLVTVEPGVTQQQLRDFLDQHNLPFMVPATGAGPGCSILANALERGYGITPYTDHFAAVNSIKGLLADGSPVQSAVTELDGSGQDFIDKTYKYGVGPYLDGLWTQSNLAIVTAITLRLKAEPEAFAAFYLQFANDNDLELAQNVVFNILQKLEGVVGSVNIMDQRRVAAMMADNPNGAGVHQVMSAAQVQRIAKDYDIPAWTVAGTLYGQKTVVRAAKAEVKRFVAGQAKKIIFSNSLVIQLGRKITQLLPEQWLAKPRKMLASLDAGMEIMRGIPNQVALPLAYWRNPRIKPDKHRAMNPAADGCGLLWYAPLIPMQPQSMRRFIEHVRHICPQYGIEPMITFTNLRHDTVDSTIPIVFDRQNPLAVEQASQCLAALVEQGLQQGWVPYRLNLMQQQHLLDADAPFWRTVSKLKAALDPYNIISPGRYQPAATPATDKQQ